MSIRPPASHLHASTHYMLSPPGGRRGCVKMHGRSPSTLSPPQAYTITFNCHSGAKGQSLRDMCERMLNICNMRRRAVMLGSRPYKRLFNQADNT